MAPFNPFENAIDFSFWREICEEQGKLKKYRRGEFFVHSGSVMKYAGWIIKGGFKHALLDNAGNEKAVGFVFEQSILANYLSCVLGRIMPTDIIALEDSEVLVVPSELIKDRLIYDPTLNIHFAQALFEQAYEHILNDYRSTPEQRYKQLILRYPRILSIITLGEIASYLNISRRHLHRIRESMLTDNPDVTT